jgi:microcystin-dependent protein
MGQPYVGEIRMFAGNFAPVGWMLCQGQLLPISENETLFQLIGTTYGGDGQSTFALPNLASRVPLHMGQGSGLSSYQIGQSGGVETVTLTQQQIPNHTHVMQGTNSGQQQAPAANTIPASVTSTKANVHLYGPAGSAPVTLNAQTISAAGGNQPHDNMKPFLVINFIIALFGVFPTQT